MMFLAYVTHDIQNNTLEATWLEPQIDINGSITGYERVKTRNYSKPQKSDFLSDCGTGSDKYTTMAGW